MNNLPTVFNFEEVQVRVVTMDGEPWFVAVDVCKVLEIQNPTDVLKRLDEDERARFNLGRQGEANVVNEYGLYSLILGSKKSEAKKFKRWVTHEVIPAIRKTGSYSVPQSPMSVEDLIIMQAQSMKDMKAQVAALKTELVETKSELSEAKQRAEIANTRMDAWDNIGTIGDKRQKLNKMVQKYAAIAGVSFSKAWKEFRTAYNTAHRTNLTSLVNHYKQKHGIRQLSIPDYLERIHSDCIPVLDDAIRVADKMLNQAEHLRMVEQDVQLTMYQ